MLSPVDAGHRIRRHRRPDAGGAPAETRALSVASPPPPQAVATPPAVAAEKSGSGWACLLIPLIVAIAVVGVFVSTRVYSARRTALHARARAIACRGAQGGAEPQTVLAAFAQLNLSHEEIREALAWGFRDAAAASMSDRVLDEREYAALSAFHRAFGGQMNPAHPQVVEALLFMSTAAGIAELLNGRVPRFPGSAPPDGVVLQRGERFVWAYYGYGVEAVTMRHTTHQTSSVGVRVARGVYYRVGSGVSIPRLVTTAGRRGTGVLVFTTKAITFIGGTTSTRMPFDKVVRVVPADDGLVLNLESATRPLFVIAMLPAAAWVAAMLAANLPSAMDE